MNLLLSNFIHLVILLNFVVQIFPSYSFQQNLSTFHTQQITSVQIMPDQLRIITGSRDHFVKVWSLVDYSLLWTSPDYGAEITKI